MTIANALPGEFVEITMNPVTEPFWQAAKERRLVAPKCAACGTFRLPPTPYCPECQSDQVDWVELSGKGEVYSFAVVHGYPGMPELTLVPVVVTLLDAPGARLISNVVDVDPEEVAIGAQLTVDFHEIKNDWLLPVFRLTAD